MSTEECFESTHVLVVAHFSFCDDIRKYKIHVAAWTLDNDYADKEF